VFKFVKVKPRILWLLFFRTRCSVSCSGMWSESRLLSLGTI